MYENAYEIFEYLPIEQAEESVYIQHLWGSFRLLNESEEPIKAFSLLPFHLLFMFAVQYKVYRLSAFDNARYLEIINSCNLRDPGNKQVLDQNAPIKDENGVIPSSCSVKNLSFIPERRLFDFLKIIDCEDDFISRAKVLVDSRGNYAHANGQIERDVNARVDEYLEILDHIQAKISSVNKTVLMIDEGVQELDELDDYLPEKFIETQFSPKDVGSVILNMLQTKVLTENQYNRVISCGIDYCRKETLDALRFLTENELDDSKRIIAQKRLPEVL